MMKVEELIYGAWVLMRDGDDMRPVRIRGLEMSGMLHVERDDGSHDVMLDAIIPLPIESSILRRFGFKPAKGDNVWVKQVCSDIRLTIGLRHKSGVEQARRCAISGRIACWNEEIRYVHELQRWFNDRVYFIYDIPLRLRLGNG